MNYKSGVPSEYRERVAEQVRPDDPRFGRLGYKVAASKDGVRIIPQTQGAQIRRVGERAYVDAQRMPVSEEQQQLIQATLPGDIRRTARQRYADLIHAIQRDAHIFYHDGRFDWPQSVRNELNIIGNVHGKPRIDEEIEALARKWLVKGARLQQEKDAKRVTRGWHGHLSA